MIYGFCGRFEKTPSNVVNSIQWLHDSIRDGNWSLVSKWIEVLNASPTFVSIVLYGYFGICKIGLINRLSTPTTPLTILRHRQQNRTLYVSIFNLLHEYDSANIKNVVSIVYERLTIFTSDTVSKQNTVYQNNQACMYMIYIQLLMRRGLISVSSRK